MATPPGSPESGDLKAAEKKAVDSVRQHTEQGGAEDGLAAYRSAYSQFAKTHTPQEAQQFVRDTMKTFSDQKLSPELAAAFGFSQESGKPMDDRLHAATIDALAKSANPLDAALAQELKAHANAWNAQKTEGGFLGFGASPTDGVRRQDLFDQLNVDDQAHFDHRHSPLGDGANGGQGDAVRNVINRGLLDGGPNNLFERVFAGTGHKHSADKPDEDTLSRDDFQNYLQNGKNLSDRDRAILQYTIKNWDSADFHPLEPIDELSGDTRLSKRSIRDGIDGMATDSAMARDIGQALTQGGNDSIFAQVARSLGKDPATAVLTESDFQRFRDERKDQLGPNELIALHRTLLAYRNGKLGELGASGGDIERPSLTLQSIKNGIDLTNYSPY